MGELLARTGVRQLAIAETQKFGHVTYFWNGNRSGKFDEKLETYVEIPSDGLPFEKRPWMKAAEITDRVIAAVESDAAEFIRANFANGDMVGHTGNFQATVLAVDSVDLALTRIIQAVAAARGVLVVTADHGNADDKVERDKDGEPLYRADGTPVWRTAHSLNPVPFWVKDYTGRESDSPTSPAVGLPMWRPPCSTCSGSCRRPTTNPAWSRRPEPADERPRDGSEQVPDPWPIPSTLPSFSTASPALTRGGSNIRGCAPISPTSTRTATCARCTRRTIPSTSTSMGSTSPTLYSTPPGSSKSRSPAPT